jgi:uncharacterized protein YbjT (DUF2867 family)
MILIAGGSGNLGSRVVRLLTDRGLRVRVLTRDLERASHLKGDLVEIVRGDVRDRESVEQAMDGVQTVISAMHGFNGDRDCGPEAVDSQGNDTLIHAAERHGVEHFILMSIKGAAPDSPAELFRMKYAAETVLRSSSLAWTIIRPTAFMETWCMVIGEPLVKTGRTRIFGRGNNPVNFVSVADVARYVELAVVDPSMRGVTVEVGGPENLTMRQFVQTFETVTGKTGRMSRIPLPMMRVVSVVMRRKNPILARHAGTGVVMDTDDMTFDGSDVYRRFPSIRPTSLPDVVRRDYVVTP